MQFVYNLRAIGKGRPRINTYTHVAYTPKATQAYETALKARTRALMSADDKMPYQAETALRIEICAFYAMPKSWSKKKRAELDGKPMMQKPDCDNAAKAILDALNGLVYNDDKQVTELHMTKIYSTEDKIIVKITEAENECEYGKSGD